MQNSLVDYSNNDLQKGFRLHRLEVYNWGTFHDKVWKIKPTGFNSLLTGDIGSGKSTLVDAILTLLVPHHKIVYNKAAGAENRERSLLTYVRGEYKNQRSEYNSSSPVYLRQENDYSVLLARFNNKGYDLGYTLAQVFWIRNKTVEKFFIISKQDLNIKEHFTIQPNDKDISSLKKRLKSLDNTEIFDFFRDYSSKFRLYFGIKSEKVLELFYQTVSMKSVGKLTEFMRDHMLEKQDVKEKIDEIKRNYDNLTKSHAAVQRAKKQLEQLVPLDKEIRSYQEIIERNNKIRNCIEYLQVFFAERKYTLLEEDIQKQSLKKERLVQKISDISTDLDNLREQEKNTFLAINENKEGRMISQLENKITSLEQDKALRIQRNQEYSQLCFDLQFQKEPNENQFYKTLTNASNVKNATETDLSELVIQRDTIVAEYLKLREAYDTDNQELDSLLRRKTKIPEDNIRIRNVILEALKIEESELPFVGELLQIKTDEKRWEGAIERVLHSFGLSLLVAERDYKDVSALVDKTNLKGKIVYYKIPEQRGFIKRKEPEKNTLIGKIDIKADSEFYDWISNELYERFNYVCCESIEQFQKETRALTQNGQIKGNRGRHEKDDKRNIHDQRNFILGWNNQEKIRSIKQELASLEKRLKDNDDRKGAIEKKKLLLETQRTYLHDLLKFKDFSEINWKKTAEEIEQCKAEIEELKKTSDLLNTLKTKLDTIQKEINSHKAKNDLLQNEVGQISLRISDYEQSLLDCKRIISENLFEATDDLLPIINSVISDEKFEIKNIDTRQENARKLLVKTVEENSGYERKLSHSIISKMAKFKQDYPEDTIEMIAVIDAVDEYQKFFEKIKTEDLPRYEEKFKEQLKEGTINDIAIFKSQLEDNAKNIERNIRLINQSLRTIEYSTGTYIELSYEKNLDIEINEFKIQLKNCLEGTTDEKTVYSEDKFNQVKKILDRFNSSNINEINWTNKVTDVRNWYSFSAIEKFISTNLDKEFYSDSSGKSGGQKEKLAYTILASALAYQFGPAGDNPKSKSFRFVMIDEAFGRGSDESTRYGLDLFKKLDLQLLIITPLQKIHIIENYINCVHLVSNEEGNNSMTRDIPIQEYQENQKSK
jgi:uncharacterized protein YPO0396